MKNTFHYHKLKISNITTNKRKYYSYIIRALHNNATHTRKEYRFNDAFQVYQEWKRRFDYVELIKENKDTGHKFLYKTSLYEQLLQRWKELNFYYKTKTPIYFVLPKPGIGETEEAWLSRLARFLDEKYHFIDKQARKYR